MADTQRTIAELEALFVVNATGDVGVQDIRDVVATMSTDSAKLYTLGNSTETVISTVLTWTLADLGTPTLAPGAVNFDNPSGQRLRYVGATTRTVNLVAAVSSSTASNNREISYGFAKNGVILPETETRRKSGTGADVGALAIVALVPGVVNGDYFELWVENDTDDTNITIEYYNLAALGFPE